MATTIATLAQQFLDHGRYLRGWSPKTTRTYTQAFALFSFDSADDLSKASLQQFVRSLQERGLSPGGVNVRLRSVNSLLTWLHEEGHTGERLRVRLLRAPVRTITPLSDHDVRRLVGFKSTVIRMRRVHALAMVLLDTGLRIEEALTLLRTRVDLERRCLTVLGKGSRERTVPISDEGRKALFRWLSKTTSGPYVICTQRGGRMTYRNAYRDLKALCARAGVTGAHVHPHALRHAFATNYLRCGGDVYRLSRVLGHASITTTACYLRSMGVEHLQEGHHSPLTA
jgi:integrase/recombinase XerC